MSYKIILFTLLLCTSVTQAQEKLNSLKAPTSPAASVLGLQPTAVLSPKSYQALETAMFSNFSGQGGNGIIPNDFALEFTPYWTKDHSLSLEEYLFPKRFIDQLARNSSFSIASTQNFILEDSTATNGLAIGYRVTFFMGNNKDKEKINKYQADFKENAKIQINIMSGVEELIGKNKISNKDDFFKRIDSILIKTIYEIGKLDNIKDAKKLTDKIHQEALLLDSFDPNNPDIFLDKFYSLVDENLNSGLLFEKFKIYIRDRQGFSLDVAYAGLLNFPTDQFEFSVVPRQSFWLTPTYRFKDKYSFLKVMGVLRYEWYNDEYYRKYFPESEVYTNGLDYGVALSTVFNKFSIQFEMVGRSSNSEILSGTDSNGNQLYRKENGSDFQYIGTFSYNISDQIILTYSLGNKFKPVQDPENTLVSILALNFGFGAPTKEDLKF